MMMSRPRSSIGRFSRQRGIGYHALIAFLREPSPPKMAVFSLFELWMRQERPLIHRLRYAAVY